MLHPEIPVSAQYEGLGRRQSLESRYIYIDLFAWWRDRSELSVQSGMLHPELPVIAQYEDLGIRKWLESVSAHESLPTVWRRDYEKRVLGRERGPWSQETDAISIISVLDYALLQLEVGNDECHYGNKYGMRHPPTDACHRS
jgi:hypothetical protein